MSRNFHRTCTLSLSGPGGKTIVRGGGSTDLAVQFAIESRTSQAPDQAQIVIYNASPATAAMVENEFTDITLSAGYDGNEGPIFYGSIVETQYGEKVDKFTTTVLRIYAAAFDKPYNQARVNTSLAAGCSPQDVVDTCVAAMQPFGINGSRIVGVDLSQPKFPRGVVLAGMARDYLREVALSAEATWNLDQGQVNVVGVNASYPGKPIVLSPSTGLVSQPIKRQLGVICSCLINPAIQLSTNIDLRSKVISSKYNLNNDPAGVLDTTMVGDFDSLNNATSIYRVLHIKTDGNTRGGDWEMELTLGVGNGLNFAQAAAAYDPNLGGYGQGHS